MRSDRAAPTPPFLGTRVITDFAVAELFEYVNPLALYSGQYRLRRLPDETRVTWWSRVQREIEPDITALQSQIVEEALFQPQAVYGFFRCWSEGNDLLVEPAAGREPVRFTFPRQPGGRRLCLSDYFRSGADGGDVVGLQLVTLGDRVAPREQELFASDRYTGTCTARAGGRGAGGADAPATAARGDRDQDSGTVEGLFRQQYRGARYNRISGLPGP